jgi:hypothetical protein
VSAAFTPGPWRLDGDHIVAGLYGEDRIGSPLGDTPEQAEANGRLIAAAPELYEALVGLAVALECLGYPDEAKQARALLAKARGEQ